MSTSDEGCAATIAANSNDVCLSADRGLTREAVIPTTCSEDVKQPEAFGSFVEQLLDAAAWPEDIAATGITGSLLSYKVHVWKAAACQVHAGVDKLVGCNDAAKTDKLLQLMPHSLVHLITH